MYLMVVVINHKEQLNPVLEKFVEIGIKGATILDSTGMGRTILDCEAPLVGGLRKLLLGQCRSHNTTIFSVIETKEKIEEAIEAVESITGDLNKTGIGIAFAVPLEFVKGFPK